ncbi:uncharacterized protein LOC106694146 [Microplitis demolitor]|uniref:uncharacterized protein LOC106694146 n=1 Tax=Microplitis demolitor TaxID=69319 RepID=UPI00235B6EF2|nr:uncharacterized protein LOC106694146 [Microplitis demolitor]
MSKRNTYGSICEIMAAAEIFSYRFEVYQGDCIIASVGEAIRGVKRLRSTGHDNNGHYDVYLSVLASKITVPQTQENILAEVLLPQLIPNVELQSSSESVINDVNPLQSNGRKKRRKRVNYTIRKRQLRQATLNYTHRNPDVHRKATKKYASNNPHVSRAATTKYNEKRLQIKLMSWTLKALSGLSYEPSIDYQNDKIVNLGHRLPCSWCRALKWKDEAEGMCCSGEVKEGSFMPTFKVQGQVCHRIGSLMVENNQQPSFLQIYFVGDDNREREIRCGICPSIKPELIHQLQNLLHEHHQYIKDFKVAIESVPKNQKEFQVIINADKKPPGEHRGRFNAQMAKEVAVIIAGQNFEKKDIILNSRDDKLKRISEIHRAYDTLQYPLMFCRGEDGYHINIPKRDGKTKRPLNKTVSASEFYSYRIMERNGEENHLLLFRTLLNQFLVDMYAKIETERLNWIRNHQTNLRSEEYVHLKDALTKTDGQITEIGKMVVLPSSFTGGPRYMHERTQDDMTYVRHFGRPDFFITFTCNPKWKEIEELLVQGQKYHDRHDLIVRIFYVKIKHMMNLLTKGCIFVNMKCHMYTVEWQKRRLPHIHILLWLEEKLRPESIDKVISAELPNQDQDQELYEKIKTNMIHGPCGSFNRNSPRMVDGSCTKKYPKHFIKETQLGEDGYPKYRRRSPEDGGVTTIINGINIDNRWVVPYNPVLCRTFKAHINVEVCNSVKSIKYICKYINEGSDQAAFTVGDLDEVTKYEAGRYISTSEAVSRILSFPIHERFPPVMHLAVHLENGQRVFFNENNILNQQF